jgi:hypothetical protein
MSFVFYQYFSFPLSSLHLLARRVVWRVHRIAFSP